VPVADTLVLGDVMQYAPAVILNILIMIMGVALIGIILLQRGKGGGLAGAFGGIGGSSAFGSRAGDQFTRVTLIMAGIWILLIMLMVYAMPKPPKPSTNEPVYQGEETGRLWLPEGPSHPTQGMA
jgi:preprotein translocase subunit SecG